LAAKPLDEILELPPELQYPVVEEEDEEDLEPDAEETEFAEEFGLKELDEALDSIEAVEITFTESESDEDLQTDSAADEEDTAQAESTEIDFSVNEDDSKTQH